jgi:diaminohydroxyphosphoribosylaminopyrimidine deaminase/5-amino-6-(5-phosphoribosylamino)uracil reductase
VVVVDSRLELPTTARLFQSERPVWVYTALDDPTQRAALQAQGATVITLHGPGGKVDLAAMLRDLGQREINELHVEAGHKLNGSLVRGGLVDEFLVYLAPTLLGAGRGLAALGPLASLDQGVRLEFVASQAIGPDLRVVARVAGRERF